MNDKVSTFGASAYGGDGWLPRAAAHREEIGTIWAPYGIDSEWRRLRAVLLHRPGEELSASADPEAVNMLAPLDLGLARDQHGRMAAAYRAAGVTVHDLDPGGPVTPNQMFCADLVFMTPEGAILARPASSARAGEERLVATRLAALGVPILATLTGHGTFEGADGAWLDEKTVLIGLGLRTNRAAVAQIESVLARIGVETIAVDMPFGTMHLMGMLRIVDRDLAIAWPRRTPHRAIMALRERGCEVVFLPATDEHSIGRGLNFVTLGPRRILMADGYGALQSLYEANGIDCLVSPVDELAKAAGAIGCLSAVLSRDLA